MERDQGLRGTGPRLISVAEAAEILRVSAQDVLDLVAGGDLESVTGPDGAPRIQVADELHERRDAIETGFTLFVTPAGGGFDQHVRSRRRRRELEGLDFGEVDVGALTARLTSSLAAAVPASVSVNARDGVILVSGAGADVVLCVACGGSTEDRLVLAGQRLLETASEAIAEATGDPWPARTGQFPGGLPPCHAWLDGGALRMSYGDPAVPILTLAPVPLADVVRR